MVRLAVLLSLSALLSACTAFALRTPHPMPLGAIGGGTLGAGEVETHLGGGGGPGCDRITARSESPCGSPLAKGHLTGGLEIGTGKGVSIIPAQGMVRGGYSLVPLSLAWRGGLRYRSPTAPPADGGPSGGTVVLGMGGSFGAGGLGPTGVLAPTLGADVELAVVGDGGPARPRVGLGVAVVAPVEASWGDWSSGPWIYVLPGTGVGLKTPRAGHALDLGLSGWIGAALRGRTWVAAGVEFSIHWVARGGP